MGSTAAEIQRKMRDAAKDEADAEAERNGTLKPRNACTHPPQRGVRCVMYKGAKPMNVTYCEMCGAMGPAAGVPTLGQWVNNETFRS